MILTRQHGIKHKQIGYKIATHIRDNSGWIANKENREDFCKELRCSQNTFYFVLKVLKDSKVIIKDGKKYYINIDLAQLFLGEWNAFIYKK